MKLQRPCATGYADMDCDDISFAVGGLGPVYNPNTTTNISGRKWQRLYDGMAFALRQGIVMNVHVTIVWGLLGIYDHDQASGSLEGFREALRHYARPRHYPFGCLYVYENTPKMGLHTHLLTTWAFAGRVLFRSWAENYAKRIAKGLPFKPEAIIIRHRKDGVVDRHWRWFDYVTKGVDPTASVRDLDNRHIRHPQEIMRGKATRNEGSVCCKKRVGVSRNLDYDARSQVHFRSVLARGANTKEALYTDAEFRTYELEKRNADLLRSFGGFSLGE